MEHWYGVQAKHEKLCTQRCLFWLGPAESTRAVGITAELGFGVGHSLLYFLVLCFFLGWQWRLPSGLYVCSCSCLCEVIGQVSLPPLGTHSCHPGPVGWDTSTDGSGVPTKVTLGAHLIRKANEGQWPWDAARQSCLFSYGVCCLLRNKSQSYNFSS